MPPNYPSVDWVVRRKLNKEEEDKLVMNSENYAQLFFSIIQTPDYTESLAKKTNLKMGTIGERLYHLLSVGLIKKGNKVGRIQYYEVDWDGFYSHWKDSHWKGYVKISPSTTYEPILDELSEDSFKKYMLDTKSRPIKISEGRTIKASLLLLGCFYMDDEVRKLRRELRKKQKDINFLNRLKGKPRHKA